MPMLRKKPFVRNPIPEYLKDEDLVYYCDITDEIFQHYSDLSDRIILCNSLVWSCQFTGKQSMTYQEAKACEDNARAALKEFPLELRIPVLYLASLTRRTSFENMAEDVFSFARERYFVGESVEVNITEDTWCECHVMQIVSPTEEELECFEDASCGRYEAIPASLFRYEIESYEEKGEVREVVVKASQVHRKKGLYTRDKNRLYLKQFAEEGPSGLWVIKKDILQKFAIPRVKFDTIFIGKPPEFQASKNTRKALANKPTKQKVNTQNKKQTTQNTNNKKEKKQESIQRYLTTLNDQNKKKTQGKNQPLSSGKQIGQHVKKTPQKEMAQKVKEKYRNAGGVAKKFKNNLVMSAEKLQLLKEQQKERALVEKKRKLEERSKERAKKKEDKLRLAEFMKQWNRLREDLECEDLKALPTPTPIQCRVPNQHFGDFLMILEFFLNFSDALSTKDYFPYGVTFDLVERALSDREVAGPFSDMLQFLLQTLFMMQEEENDEIVAYKTSADLEIDERVDLTTAEAIKSATAAASWSQLYQGTPVSKLSLDSVTVTEVLRLHLLSSGGRCSEMNAKWRYQERGGYTSHDDPGLMLRIHNPHILRALSVKSVFELPLGDKLTIMTCLMDQILTYAALRDVIDERCEKARLLKIDLKAQNLALLRRERELTSLRIKQRRDAKQKPKVEAAGAAVVPSTDSPDSTPISEEDLARLEKDIVRRQADVQRKTSELHAISMGHRVVPLGTDRAHRRFWVFNSLPGLFVEHFPQHVGPCLGKPTPDNPGLSSANDTDLYVRRLFEEERGTGGSDKENDSYEEAKRPAVSPKKSSVVVHSNEAALKAVADEGGVAPLALVCTAGERCPVHSETSDARTEWSFFSTELELQTLIENLSSRGIRESDLKQSLMDERLKIIQALPKCPVHKLDPLRPCTVVPEERKGRSTYTVRYEDSNLHYPPETPAEMVLELSLRDLILELEEKVYCGGLGIIKVQDRDVWRNLISCRQYEKQCDQLTWGGKEQDETIDNIPHLKLNGVGGRRSRPSTPASQSGTPSVSRSDTPSNVSADQCDFAVTPKQEAADPSVQELAQSPVVRDLASAILQISQCVEKKFRQKPLAPEESSSKSPTQIERWEMSLMASTSFSQLCVHYYTFESSIQWSKSALNAYCRLCRRRGDPVNMLLCDSCNKGHHMYCLKPKLTKVPQGDWFCPKCRPQEKTPRAPRKRTVFVVEEEEEEDEEEEEEGDEDEEESFIETEVYTEVCDTCGEGGRVICCDTETCPLVFHIECLNPPLKKVPRGKWFCPKCKTPSAAELHAAEDVDNDWLPEAAEHSPPSSRNRRCCTAATVAKISEFAKRLRSKSWDNDSAPGSVQSDDQSSEQPSRRSARHSLEPDLDLPLNNALLQDLLSEVMHHKDSWPFLRPVPKAQVPDYHLIIKRPMDLGTIKNKLNMSNYVNNSEFIADALLIFENCRMYNQLDAEEYRSGVRLCRFFEKRCKELGLQLMVKNKPDKSEPERKRLRTEDK